MTYQEWLTYGIEKQWVLPPVCQTHDGTPLSETEEQTLIDGDDICINVIRVCESEDWQAIYDNTTSMKWRDIK